MECVTYKWCQFHQSHWGNLARHRRAMPRECRFSGRDSETPQSHTRWPLRWYEQGVKRKREGEMQHEVMIATNLIMCVTWKACAGWEHEML